ncbi:ADP-heptose:LPS heptosyltransferase II [Candidatus Symbiobacter mobilis CR]|uniref:lipopolysaccharide heptosyltransferase II n=1 Tax=Candidatus Symbiobacter mobilis CR TaxID=946483 RepID=U5N7P3_9BURK|nr:ADP-heptose:LPS heptosyltransferase II [Candidatus Symbiobacter mobilis CR]
MIAPQWIGDAVMTEPLLRRLHLRGERLTVAALPAIAPVYRAMPQVCEVLELPFVRSRLQPVQRFRWARQWRGRFDIAYVCPNSFKSALLPWLASIARRVGYLGEMRYGLLTHRLPNPSRLQRMPMVQWYLALAGDAVGDAFDVPRLTMEAGQVDIVLRRFGLERGGYHVLAPGAEYGPAKRWPVGHFAALARGLDRPVVLVGAARDAQACQAVCSHAPGVRDLAGQTTLTEAMAILAAAHCVVSNDSGLMHIAAAFSVPQVAVFGSSSPLHTPPNNPRAQVLWRKTDPDCIPPLDCAPCFARACPHGHTRCLHELSVPMVLRAVEDVVGRAVFNATRHGW